MIIAIEITLILVITVITMRHFLDSDSDDDSRRTAKAVNEQDMDYCKGGMKRFIMSKDINQINTDLCYYRFALYYGDLDACKYIHNSSRNENCVDRVTKGY